MKTCVETTQYTDVYMRDFDKDKGTIPSAERIDLAHSPDIIPTGTSPLDNYLTVLANNFYGPYDYYKNIEAGSYNYIYVRGYNRYPGAQQGKIYLYYSPASLLLVPALWINNQIPNANGGMAANFSVQAENDILVGDAPFYWNPPGGSSDHYCLIAQVVTQQDPNTIPTDDDLEDFGTWVAKSPGIAQRNVFIVDNQTDPSFSGFQTIVNPENSAKFFGLSVTCTGVPDGTAISLRCAVPGPEPQINLSGTIGPSNQQNKDGNVVNVLVTATMLPANFHATVEVTAQLPDGGQWPKAADIQVSSYLAVQESSKSAHLAIPAWHLGLAEEDLGDAGRLLLLGDFTYQIKR